MNWLRNFMIGRYGVDQLSLAMVILACIINIIFSFIRIPYLSLIPFAIIVVCMFRILSKNISKRYAENQKFLKLTMPLVQKFRTAKVRHADQAHKYYKCSKCGQQIRVPRGKGKIKITCPKCGYFFIKKT